MNDTSVEGGRVLGVDVRPHRAGYACIELPEQVVDFGVFRFVSLEEGGAHLSLVIRKLRPTTLVLRKIGVHSKRYHVRTKIMQAATATAAHATGTKVVFVKQRHVSDHFNTARILTKYEIATELARRFPELGWYVPPKRKPWLPENRHMLVFDAVAMVVSFLDS